MRILLEGLMDEGKRLFFYESRTNHEAKKTKRD
jgi:hypothetical protein